MVRCNIPGLIVAVMASVLAVPAWAADESPPTITHTPTQSSPRGNPVVIRAAIEDPAGVFDPTLLYRLNGEGAFQRLSMVAVPGEENMFVATVPAAVVTDETESVDYFIEAYDNEGNGPTLKGSEKSPLSLAIRAAAAPDEGDPSGTPGPDATANPDANPPTENPPATADESEGSGLGLWLGIGAGVAGVVVIVAVAAAAGAGAYFYFTRPDTLDEVTINVSGPSPVAVP